MLFRSVVGCCKLQRQDIGAAESSWDFYPADDIEAQEKVRCLGGPSVATQRLGRYLTSPALIAEHKERALGLLCYCGEEGISAMARFVGNPNAKIRREVARAFLLAMEREHHVMMRINMQGFWDPLCKKDLSEVWQNVADSIKAQFVEEHDADTRLLLAFDLSVLLRDRSYVLKEAEESIVDADPWTQMWVGVVFTHEVPLTEKMIKAWSSIAIKASSNDTLVKLAVGVLVTAAHKNSSAKNAVLQLCDCNNTVVRDVVVETIDMDFKLYGAQVFGSWSDELKRAVEQAAGVGVPALSKVSSPEPEEQAKNDAADKEKRRH